MNTLMFLQVAVSLLFFVQKAMLAFGRKSGWLIGILAASLGVLYFWRVNLFVYTTLEFGLIAIFGYALFAESASKDTLNQMRVATGIVMVALTCFAWKGALTMIEFGSSAGLLIGSFLLADGYIRSGWFISCIAHALGAWLGFSKGQHIFADFQVASAIVSILATAEMKKMN